MAEQVQNHDILANCHIVRARMELKEQHIDQAKAFVERARAESLLRKDKSTGIVLSQHLTVLYEELGEVDQAKSVCMELLPLSFAAHRFRNVAWTLLKLSGFHENDGDLELAAIAVLAAAKLQAEFPSKQGEKSKSLLTQLIKRHGVAAELVSAKRKAPWQQLIKLLPYMGR
jgi:hypothetical protein